MNVDAAVLVDTVVLFAKRHVRCGRLMIDLPTLPEGRGYRVVMACRCGDTLEEWVDEHRVPRGVVRAAFDVVPPATSQTAGSL